MGQETGRQPLAHNSTRPGLAGSHGTLVNSGGGGGGGAASVLTSAAAAGLDPAAAEAFLATASLRSASLPTSNAPETWMMAPRKRKSLRTLRHRSSRTRASNQTNPPRSASESGQVKLSVVSCSRSTQTRSAR